MARTEHPTSLLDTSALRPLLMGSTTYRQYLKEQVADNTCHISKYVLMEFRRSYLRNIIAFYFYLTLPTVRTVGDAFQLWSHQFKGSRLKAIIQLVGQLLDSQELSLDSPSDLEKARLALGRYIKRLDVKTRRQFHLTEQDNTHCARAQVPVKVRLHDLTADLERFMDAFDNTKRCRSLCQIDHFLLKRYRVEIECYVNAAQTLDKDERSKGFVRLAGELEEVLQKGSKACSCHRCEKIGDAVIALDADRGARVEHTDHSFNDLCPPLDQPHRQHLSEIAVLKRFHSD